MKILIAVFSLSLISCLQETERSTHKRSTLPKSLDQTTPKYNYCQIGFLFVVEFDPGQRPKIEYKTYSENITEIPTSVTILRPKATKVLEAGTTKISFREEQWVHFLGAPGHYRSEALVDGKVSAKSEFSFVSVRECPSSPDVSMFAPAVEPLVMEENIDYYPLESGDIIAIDKSSGVATSLKSAKKYKEVEIVRELQEIRRGWELTEKIASWEPEVKLEKDMEGSGKVSIGKFQETGIYRGEIADSKFEDSLMRQIFVKEE